MGKANLGLMVLALVLASLVPAKATAPAKSSNYTGTYKMKEQGAAGLALVQQTADGRIKFYVNATYRMNTGEVSGEILMSGKSARYVDKELDLACPSTSAPAALS